MSYLSKIVCTFILVIISGLSITAQIPPLLVYDTSNEQINALYYLDIEGERNCAKITPVVGTVIKLVDDESFFSMEVKSGRSIEYFEGVDMGNFPIHIKENLNNFLLKKGSSVKIWGYACGSGGFLSITHIARFDKVLKAENPPHLKESVLEENPNNALQNLIVRNKEIADKVKQIEEDFDKEIAPNILTGGKGEFETTQEAKARLAKLQQIRTANSSKLWKKLYIETNSQVEQYLKIVGSFYAVPLKGTLGRYDADTEIFPIIIPNKGEYKLNIPRSIAPSLKRDFDKAKVYIDYAIGKSEGEWFVKPKRLRIAFNGQTFFSDPWQILTDFEQ